MQPNRNQSIVILVSLLYAAFMSFGAIAADEEKHEEKEHADHDHDHDHSEFEYLYGNHYCHICNYADLVDPHFYADISNKKAGVYARIYVCSKDCAEDIKKDVGKHYKEVYRTDRKSGKEKPALDLTRRCGIY